jgi:hypothetical protein
MGIRRLRTASISTGVKSSKFWDQSSVIITNSYESITTVTVGSSGSSTITFSSIPATYTHLQVRGMALSNLAEANLMVRFNSDSGANYARHYVGGNGSTTFASGVGSTTFAQGGLSPNSTQPAAYIMDILDYKDTNKNTTVRSFYGDDKNGGTGYLFLASGLWVNTSAITSIVLEYAGGTAIFNQYSQFALYGIKGA